MQTEALLDTALDVAQLVLRFARVDRVTCHEDGVTPESDTDHTVMLGILGCALAARYQPDLDLGKVSQFAFVHDLPEAYAGDTVTASPLNPEQKRAKADREAAAIQRIDNELGRALPWIAETIRAYEAQDTPEARFIKALDKVLPKLTHILNQCVRVPHIAYDPYHEEQRAQIHALAAGQAWLIQLWEDSVADVMAIVQQQTPDPIESRQVRRVEGKR